MSIARKDAAVPIPRLREDGYLPDGLHKATQDEVAARFGQSTPRRRYLIGRLERWLQLARDVGARGLFVKGSFVTSRADPGDIDAVVWLPDNFRQQVELGRPQAVQLESMLRARQPEELFAAHSQEVWEGWLGFFSRTREADGRRKGVVEVRL